ncbi:ATP-binding cassette domain-containing protein [Paenibacillus tarimensis]
MNDAIIEVTGLSKMFKVPQKEKEGLLSAAKSLFSRKFKHVHAIKGIDLHIRKGEICGLIGPNGAGKSTTIKVLSGILHPTEGSVKVMGHVPWLERETYVRKIGALFGQKTQLWWDVPAFDTFALHKVMYNIDDVTYRATIREFDEILGLDDVMNRPVRQLSLGERMKCELVCAMLHAPELIFLDEPTIGLDILAKEAIRSFIKRINKERGTTFIVTTHDMSDIEDLCERVTVINHGTIVYDAAIEQMKRFFSERKIIDIRLSKPIEERSLSDYEVTTFNGITASLELDLTKNDLQTQISEIFSRFPVQDINVNNIPIEQVIKEIYGKQAG